jgi:predicted Zn-dependent protease
MDSKSTSNIFSATKDYEFFGEKIGSIRCAFVQLDSFGLPTLKRAIVTHELLHCLGLAHDTETGSMMNEFFMQGYPYHITDKTVKALRRKYPKQA